MVRYCGCGAGGRVSGRVPGGRSLLVRDTYKVGFGGVGKLLLGSLADAVIWATVSGSCGAQGVRRRGEGTHRPRGSPPTPG